MIVYLTWNLSFDQKLFNTINNKLIRLIKFMKHQLFKQKNVHNNFVKRWKKLRNGDIFKEQNCNLQNKIFLTSNFKNVVSYI